ncbi:hypothetical protein GXW78_11910 [Roseomonas terrae]|uniref:Uncharacterized protein n=1 Tax=Neoroseomonas terrae TaxID=424799 RepID=A0ABS5EH88_9PROT|nr:hypothetical protein [Neoroseomonas terrae]MBR0650371.1 hypothetical protein [Neoroseomonas terrae]
MAKPKPDQQPTTISAEDGGGGTGSGAAVTVTIGGGGGGGGGGGSSDMNSGEGAGPAADGAPAGAGAETDSSAPVTGPAPGASLPGVAWFNQVQAELVERIITGPADDVVDALLARLATRGLLVTELAVHDLVAAMARQAEAAPPALPAPTDDPAREEALMRSLGIARRDVFAVNVGTGTVVTIDGQKHRRA